MGEPLNVTFSLEMYYVCSQITSNCNHNTYIDMAQTAMTIRMDSRQKALFDNLCEEFGMSATTAINIFVKAVIRNRRIPFPIEAPADDEVRANGRAAFAAMCEVSQSRPEMSLDEINNEIAAARKEAKSK